MKKILAIMFSLAATASLMMLSVSAESLEVIEDLLPPVDPSQTYEEIIVPEETTTPVVTTTAFRTQPVASKPTVTTTAETKPAVTTTVKTSKPAVTTVATAKPVSKPNLTQSEVKQVAEASVIPSIALNILNLIK
ncbi:MAG: hypothetical protein J5992_07835 [Oscillospiraceae bacterium]|nr:hypothetical protein [Oscillospiraceae bacterium]